MGSPQLPKEDIYLVLAFRGGGESFVEAIYREKHLALLHAATIRGSVRTAELMSSLPVLLDRRIFEVCGPKVAHAARRAKPRALARAIAELTTATAPSTP